MGIDETPMLINQEVKGQLAKLLATENLTIEHRKVSTAYFDVEKRILCLPIWKSASNTVYDLLVGHEVGHALFTPADELNDAPRAFVNVLEDARIERMMKVKYPGLRNTFFKGYKELWNDVLKPLTKDNKITGEVFHGLVKNINKVSDIEELDVAITE